MNKHQEALSKLKTHCLSSPSQQMGEEFGFGTEYDLNHDGYEDEIELLQELVDKHEKIKKALNKVIHERINETGKVLEREEISYIQALQFVLKLLDWSEDE